MNLTEPHEETIGAAVLAIRHAHLPWYLRRALRDGSDANHTLARAVARRVEERTRLLVAREIGTLDDPAWTEAITTAKQLILAPPAGRRVAEWWKRLPAFSGTVAAACAKCARRNGTQERHVVLSAIGSSPEFLERSCSHCGYAWREQCADAPGPQNGPQGDETGPGDAREAEAANGAHSAPKETGTGHPSPEGGAPDAGGADSGPQSHAQAPGRENTRDDGPGPGSVALVPAVTASGGFGDGNPDAKVADQ